MSMATLNFTESFAAVDAGSRYASQLRDLRQVRASGVYAIYAKRGALLYVGESHTDRLYDTITRHFRKWRIGPGDALGRRRGGTMYKREDVRVAFIITEKAAAAGIQYAEIQRRKPRDNSLDCHTCADDDVAPF